MIHPCQRPPDLNVSELLNGKRSLPAPPQFRISRIRLDHRSRDWKELRDYQLTSNVTQFFSRRKREVKQGVTSFATSVVIQLQNQGGNKIEGLMDLRKLSTEVDHSQVILGGVQIGPGHDVGIPNYILIEGLMHVPKK